MTQEYYLPNYINKIHIDNGYLYVNAINNGIYVFDISNPHIPEIVSQFYPGENLFLNHIDNGYAYIRKNNTSLSIVDLSNNESPETVYVFDGYDWVSTVANTNDSFLYFVASIKDDKNVYQYYLNVFDISDKENPVKISSYKLPSYTKQIKIKDNYIWLIYDKGTVSYLLCLKMDM